jgi:hypothetical protein
MRGTPHPPLRKLRGTLSHKGRGLARLLAASRHIPQCMLGNVYTAPCAMPAGQRVVTVFSRV